MRRLLLALVAPLSCTPTEAPPAMAPPLAAEPAPPPSPPPGPPEWPDVFAATMKPHGAPHAQLVALPVDAHGRDRWLAFVGTPEVSFGAWRIAHAADGKTTADPVERWPVGARVVGALVTERATYVMLETVAALDEPAGLRGVWVEANPGASPLDGSPLALGDVKDMADLAARVAHPPAGSVERNAVSLLATLRAASASGAALTRALASGGADVGVVWQSLFVQGRAHLDAQGPAASAVSDRALAVVRSALDTQACGADACEAWTDAGRAVVRFVVQNGRWAIRSILEDAPVARAAATLGPRLVDAAADANATRAVLGARAKEVSSVLAEAPLTAAGGTIGVGLTDLSPGAPVIAVREGNAASIFVVDAVAARKLGGTDHWDAAFADVDGDGRTDVVLRMESTRAGSPISWTQVWLAPPPSVQASTLEVDLPSALATMDTKDVHAAAAAAVALPARGVGREDACRVLAAAGTPAGFRRVAASDARLLRFDEPGLPTWLPKVVAPAKVGADDVRGLGAHCADLSCRATRPYCEWLGGTDSQHFWFAWRDGNLVLAGTADYDGE